MSKSSLQEVKTISLGLIRGCSKSMNVRGRLLNVTGPLKKDTLFYCRGVLADSTGVLQVTFWNLNEVTHAQILSFEGRCVVMSMVQSCVSREGYQDRSMFCLCYNGGIGPSQAKFRTTVSTIHEVAETALYPKDVAENTTPAIAAPVIALTPTATNAPATTAPIHSPAVTYSTQATTMSQLSSANSTPRKRSPQRPEDLIRYTCVRCDAGGMPTCGTTGEPHPALCTECGFLEGPVVPYCPKTGERHFHCPV